MMRMLAAVYHGPDDLRVEDHPVPEITDHQLLLHVQCASVCATDLRILQSGHRRFVPGTIRILGHEIMGTIADVGSQVKGFHTGQRVFIAPNLGCGRCRQCLQGRNNLCRNYEAFGITLDGAFAEYMRVTAPAIEQGNVMPLGPGVDAGAASLTEPLACVLHGQEAVDVRRGDTVLIQGAGPIGLMHLLLARVRGAERVIVSDQSPERLEKARELGAHRAVNFREEDLLAEVLTETGQEGADVVIVATPAHEAQEMAPQLASLGGRINFFGGLPKTQPTIQLDSNLVHYKELVLTGTTGCSTGDCRRAWELVESGAIDLRPLISDRYPLREAAAAFSAARSRSGLKVILQPELK
jgi:L-iditol 2-dehydrogenase